jgi:acetylglutamate kinase
VSEPTALPHDSARIAVVKLGGDVLEEPSLGLVARSLREAIDDDPARRVLVVHGGGAQVTALSARLGITTNVVSGRRVTDAPTLDVLKMVVAGRLNVDLCSALARRGISAVGLHAGSGVIRATRRAPRVLAGAGPEPVDLGLVGDVTAFDRPLIDARWAAERVPVLSCLGLGADGQVLNLNADLAASQLSAALMAKALVAVSAVGGVRRDKDDPQSRIQRLTIAEARDAIASGRVVGGMIAKLEEAFSPLEAGVPSVQVVGPGEIATSLRAPGSVGTELVR